MKKILMVFLIFFSFTTVVACGNSGSNADPQFVAADDSNPSQVVGPPVEVPNQPGGVKPPPDNPPPSPPDDSPPPPDDPPPDDPPPPPPIPTKWELEKVSVSPSDDVRISHVVDLGEGGIGFIGRVNDFGLIGPPSDRSIQIPGGDGGIFIAIFNPDGTVKSTSGFETTTSGNFAVPRGRGWDIVSGVGVWEGDLVISQWGGGRVTRVDQNMLRVWSTEVARDCFSGYFTGRGMAINSYAIHFAGPTGCLMGIKHDGTVLGQLSPPPVLSGAGGVGRIASIALDTTGDPHIGVTTFGAVTPTATYSGGSDSAVMKYFAGGSTASSQWGGSGNETNEGVCVVGESVFILSGGDSAELRKTSGIYALAFPAIDISDRHSGPMSMVCTATAVYVHSNGRIEKFELLNLFSEWATPTTVLSLGDVTGYQSYIAYDIEDQARRRMLVKNGVVYVVGGSEKITRYDADTGALLTN